MTTPLAPLHAEIDARVAAIRHPRPDWPCAKGCDNCCRQLAALPQLTADEWALLKTGLAALPAQQQAVIHERLRRLGENPPAPVTCPLLDPASGACPVYAHRPIACRTYGFYVQRNKGLYCREIETQVADGKLWDVVWGNHEAIDRQLVRPAPRRALNAWLELSAASTRPE